MEKGAKNLNIELSDEQLDQVVGGEEVLVLIQCGNNEKCPYCGHVYYSIHAICPECHFQAVCKRCGTVYSAENKICPVCEILTIYNLDKTTIIPKVPEWYSK